MFGMVKPQKADSLFSQFQKEKAGKTPASPFQLSLNNQTRSKRSAFMTLFQAATKSATNLEPESASP